jgi:hypothetical protein
VSIRSEIVGWNRLDDRHRVREVTFGNGRTRLRHRRICLPTAAQPLDKRHCVVYRRSHRV